MTAPKDYTAYATKAPTTTHEFYAAWIAERTGVEVDVKGVQLAVNLYADFQKSPEWTAKRDEIKAAAEAAKLATTANKKPGSTKAERAAKKIADALETLKSQGVDVSALVAKTPVASAVELPGNPVVEAGAVVETPAKPVEELAPPATPEQVETAQKQVDDIIAESAPAPAPKPTARKVRDTNQKAKVTA